jgi:4-diphosphocytidyl-2-C-methyl-D-erythritol kinase
MILFPPAKINLGLNVLHKRADNYHELDSCMMSIPFTDVLEILPAKEFSFVQTGNSIPGSIEDNLCVKAYNLMVEKYSIQPVYIHLRKEIPMGAGLGGGSADAAFVLRGINDLYQLKCSIEELQELAATLGSDCPYFIKNEAQIAKGRGEVLSSCNLNLKGYYLKLINPGIHIGTKEAYDGIVFNENNQSVKSIVEGPILNWREVLKNDFETTAFVNHPVLSQIKEQMYSDGAIYASMSGSGSTMYGIFWDEPKLSYSDKKDYLELIFLI